MANDMTQRPSVHFRLSWIAFEGEREREAVTTARLTVFVDEIAIWPVQGEPAIGLEIFADDLLSHLTEHWKPILLRQTFPVPSAPDRPSLLRQTAMVRWSTLPPAIRENEDARISRFEGAHDLATAFAGQYGLPPLFLFRSGEEMLVDTREKIWRVDFDAACVELSRVGDLIATRLDQRAPEKWSRLTSTWRRRDEGEPTALLAWATGLRPELADTLVSEGKLTAPATVTQAVNDNNELRLAARMISGLPPEQIRQVLDLVQSFSHRNSPVLDRLSATVIAHIDTDFARHSPFEQGLAAASDVRKELKIASVQRIEIFPLIEWLGVEIRSPSVEPPGLDGLAIWGPQHGPGVLINAGSARLRGGPNVRVSWASRITAAHELCHLLLDRRHALSAVDILHGRMPPSVEQRARAFAGEFLLPSHVAASVWDQLGQPDSGAGLKAVLSRLARTYGVSASVASWKLQHGLERRDIDLAFQLGTVAPNRWGPQAEVH
jgi:hypothetical protein